MADRYAFQSPFARNQGEPWFTVGSVGVTTTMAITSMALSSLIVFAVEGRGGPIFRALDLSTSAITGAQIWRLFTWPIPTEPDIFLVLSVIFFFMVSTQFEHVLGKRTFLAYVLILTGLTGFIGALTAVLLDWTIGFSGSGMGMLFLGVAAGFAAAFVQAKSFFGIPFWALVAVFYALSVLASLGDRNWVELVMLFTMGGTALVLTKSLGHADSIEWIPTIPLPAVVTGAGAPSARTSRSSRRGRKRSKNSAGLRAVPLPTATEAEIDALLDQVNDQGMNSLTKEQKATLKRHSEEMRRRREDG